jgi:peptidoglycan/xylan/chitin deacetylase (PgdA/CDA1 family)
MTLTENQKRFLQGQIHSWTGLPLEVEVPQEYAALLLGKAEAEISFGDSRGNKDFQHNPLFWSGRLFEPVINHWLMKEIQLRNPGRKNLPGNSPWPEGMTFAICLTHDVDSIAPFSLPGRWRHIKNRVKDSSGKLKKFKICYEELPSFLNCALNSVFFPAANSFFDPWLELEESLGFRSTFFFFPDQASRYHLRDGHWYRHRDSLKLGGRQVQVTELMQQLHRRGWEVGLHATFLSYDDSQELKRQKQQMEQSLGAEIVSIRQHCLHFDITRTPAAQSRAGFRYDSTFGFNRAIGFRNGLALPFHHYDLEEDRPLPLLQIPLHIQDVALMRTENLDLSPELALMQAKTLIDRVEKVNGLITLLWHPNVRDDKNDRRFWVYAELLKYIATKPAWVATVGQIGAWWERRLRSIL